MIVTGNILLGRVNMSLHRMNDTLNCYYFQTGLSLFCRKFHLHIRVDRYSNTTKQLVLDNLENFRQLILLQSLKLFQFYEAINKIQNQRNIIPKNVQTWVDHYIL